MDIRQVREEARDLPNISEIVGQFKKQSKDTLKQIPSAQAHIKNLHKLADELNYGQIVSEKLASLAHSAIDLKIAAATNEHKKAQRLLGAFLSDPHTNIKRLCHEVPHFESQVNLLGHSYESLLEDLGKQLPLEHSVILNAGTEKAHIKKLKNITARHKEYLGAIGSHFLETTKSLKNHKEFRKMLKGYSASRYT